MSHAPREALERRHQAIRAALAEQHLDALVVTSLPNVLYLTNFTGTSAIVILTADRLECLTDSRYVTEIERLQRDFPALELTRVDGAYDVTLVQRLTALGLARVGFEAAHLTVARHAWITHHSRAVAGCPSRSLRRTDIVERSRVVKDGYEIETLREAARRLSAVAAAVLGRRQGGQDRTGNGVGHRLAHPAGRIQPHGVRDDRGQRTERGAAPCTPRRANVKRRRPRGAGLRRGLRFILRRLDQNRIDWARHARGPGRSTTRSSKRTTTLSAAVRPGASRLDIDAAARETLGRYGLAEAFGHGTGHGLGVEVHEDPRITRRRPGIDAVDTRDDAVAAGMVFTIEPGAYLPDWGGVRIEDDVLVTADGVEVLTEVTTALIEI